MLRDFMICRSERGALNDRRERFCRDFRRVWIWWMQNRARVWKGIFFLLRTCRLSASVWISHPSRNSDRVMDLQKHFIRKMLLEKLNTKMQEKMWARLRESCTSQGVSHSTLPTYFPAYLFYIVHCDEQRLFNYVKKLRESLTLHIIFSQLL